MEKYLLQQVKRMKIYLVIVISLFIITIVYGYTQTNNTNNMHPHFQEIDVERINVIEKDGKLKMVISNHEKQSPGIIDGKTLAPRDRDPGIIFLILMAMNAVALLIVAMQKKQAWYFPWINTSKTS